MGDVTLSVEEMQRLIASIDGRTQREEARDRIVAHFRTLLADEGSITPRILADADQLYEFEGLPKMIAGALSIRPAELQVHLGLKVEVPCEQCQTLIPAVRRRRRGGYSDPDKSYCPSCTSSINSAAIAQGQARKQLEEAALQQRRAFYASCLAVDAQLQASDEPLAIPDYANYLQTYLSIWEDLGAGCMICGEQPLFLCVVPDQAVPPRLTITAPPRDEMERFQRRYLPPLFHCLGVEPNRWWIYDPSGIPPSLQGESTIHQVLWRLEPRDYFVVAGDIYPILNRPLLCLCEGCTTAIDDTHTILTAR